MEELANVNLVRYERLTASKRDALIGLMDDPSPIVHAELLREFHRLGWMGSSFLEEVAGGSNRIAGKHARRLLNELRSSNPAEEFRAFIRSLNYELESGTILLCRVAYPQLQAGEFCGAIDEIANRCRELMVKPTNAREKCLVINRVLFHELGYRGNSDDYGNPENSFLNRAFETKKGLPITLSILYILVAQRLGIDLDPIGYPGHFMVGCFEDEMPFFIDPYSRGKFHTPEQLLESENGFYPLSQVSHLAPTPVREVLTRCCRNLANHYEERGLEAMAQLFASFIAEFERARQNHASQ